jgi:hypothetical protein
MRWISTANQTALVYDRLAFCSVINSEEQINLIAQGAADVNALLRNRVACVYLGEAIKGITSIRLIKPVRVSKGIKGTHFSSSPQTAA